MNILIGNNGNKIVVVADPNVLADYRFKTRRTLNKKKDKNTYFLLVYLGNIKICQIKFMYIKHFGNMSVAISSPMDYKIMKDNSLWFKRTGNCIYLSLDAILDFNKKINELKQIFNRDLTIILKYCLNDYRTIPLLIHLFRDLQ